MLGSINLSEFVNRPFTKKSEFNFNSFTEAVKISTIALNEVLDEGLPLHPLQMQRDSVRNWRQIGLGIFGLHDMFIKLNIEYGSEKSLEISDKIGEVMINASLQQSALLAKKDGAYPKYKEKAILSSEFLKVNATKETLNLIKKYGLRNSQIQTCAPTGSLSTMLGVSGGLEPIYQISYTRKTETLNNGEDTLYKIFTPIAREYMDIHNLKNEEDLPKDIFVTAQTLNYRNRIDMQSVWQKHIDASISSTVNVPNSFTIEETIDLYMLAWEKGLKGVTIFRDGCKRAGILTTNTTNTNNSNVENLSAKQLQFLLDKQIVKELEDDPNKCPKCGGKMINTGGCSECLDCGYSPCAI